MDYWGKVLGKKASKASIDLVFQTAILSEPGVKQIVAFSSTFVNRQYTLTFQVKVVDGTTTTPIVINPI